MALTLILNIGLDVAASTPISAHVAREIIRANGLIIVRDAVHTSDTEPTLVAEVVLDPLGVTNNVRTRALHQIAVDLRQDCVAAWSPIVRRGVLVGPRAADWGPFNPAYFLLLDGSRLAAAGQPA